MGSGDAFIDHVHRPLARKGITVGGPTTNSWGSACRKTAMREAV